MQLKKLIPGALLLAAMGAAHAEVSVYGLFDLSYGKTLADDENNKSARLHSGGEGDTGSGGGSYGNSTSRIGLRAAWTSAAV